MSYCMVITTLPNHKEAKDLATLLLKSKLAACVQISGVESYFEWDGEVRCESEKMMFIKTNIKHYKELESTIIEKHSYDVPEIIKIDIKDGLDSYLDWIDKVVK